LGLVAARRRRGHIPLEWITVATVRWYFTASLIPSSIDSFFDYMHDLQEQIKLRARP